MFDSGSESGTCHDQKDPLSPGGAINLQVYTADKENSEIGEKEIGILDMPSGMMKDSINFSQGNKSVMDSDKK